MGLFNKKTPRVAPDVPEVNELPFMRIEGRHAFFEHALGIASDSPREFLYELGLAWRTVSKARWVGIWLYNNLTKKFELNALTASAGTKIRLQSSRVDGGCSCEYVIRQDRPEFITDLQRWRRVLEDKATGERVEFRVSMPEQLRELGTVCMGLIPLNLPTPGPTPGEEAPGVFDRWKGVVSLHYDNDLSSYRTLEDKDLARLRLMGQATATALSRRKMEHHVMLSKQISALTEAHLTTLGVRPTEVRRKYAKELIRLIRNALNVRAVSIFWRRPFGDSVINCIGSTGLWDEQEARLLYSADDLELVEYEKGDGRWTSEVYESGTPKLERSQFESHLPRFSEQMSTNEKLDGQILLEPIWSSQKQDSPEREVLGVIRCAAPLSATGDESPRDFDQTDLTTLAFILNQISPILHTFEQRMVRENAISVVKHDLLAPLTGIRNSVDYITDTVTIPVQGDSYYLNNLRERSVRLRHLADQLAIDYEQNVRLTRERIRLDADIIAPMKRMMYHYAEEAARMSLSFNGFQEFPDLNIDPDLIERALYNLLVNAVKYGERKTIIKIDGKVMEDGFAIDVSNEGRGILEQEEAYLFRPYYRSPWARGKRQGTGLGLAVVSQIMRAHGGDVSLLRRKSPTIFRLWLPGSASV